MLTRKLWSSFSISRNRWGHLFLHHPEVMLCMLVIVLDFDYVAGGFSGVRERHIPLVTCFEIDARNTWHSAQFPV